MLRFMLNLICFYTKIAFLLDKSLFLPYKLRRAANSKPVTQNP